MSDALAFASVISNQRTIVLPIFPKRRSGEERTPMDLKLFELFFRAHNSSRQSGHRFPSVCQICHKNIATKMSGHRLLPVQLHQCDISGEAA